MRSEVCCRIQQVNYVNLKLQAQSYADICDACET